MSRRRALQCSLCACLFATRLSLAQTAPPPPDSSPLVLEPPEAFLDRDHLTGQLFGARPFLESRGIKPSASWAADFSRNVSGGLSTRGSTTGGAFDVSLEFDTNTLTRGLWPGGTFFLDFIQAYGENSTTNTGDIQFSTDISVGPLTQIGEAWFEQRFLDRFRFKFGKIDANRDFNYTFIGNDFSNSGFGLDPALLNYLPTYPHQSVGGSLSCFPASWLYTKFGLYYSPLVLGKDPGPRGFASAFRPPAALLLISESGLQWDAPGRLAIGWWHHTADASRFDGGPDEDGTEGFYVIAESLLFPAPLSSKGAPRGLGAFVRMDASDAATQALPLHVAGGLVFAGPFEFRPHDVVGIGNTTVLRASRSIFDAHQESAIEAFYQVQVTRFLTVKPDVQYIFNPGLDASLRPAVLLTLEVRVAF